MFMEAGLKIWEERLFQDSGGWNQKERLGRMRTWGWQGQDQECH